MLPNHLHRAYAPVLPKRLAIQQNLSAIWAFISCQKLAQCGLSLAAWAYQPYPFPKVDGQIDIFQNWVMFPLVIAEA